MRDKARIQKALDDKQRDYARALDTIKYDSVFRKVETESSGGRSLASASAKRTYRAHASQRQSSQQPRGPSAAPESPTTSRRGPPVAHRAARAATEQPVANGRPPPPAGPVFANFQNSFAAPSSSAAPARRAESVVPEREGPMGPPAIVKDKGGTAGPAALKRQAPATPPAPASKRRKDADETPAAAHGSPRRAAEAGRGEQHAAGEEAGAGVEEEELADEPWIWVRPDEDARGDLLAAVFAHVTCGALDMEPAVLSGPAGVHHHVRAAATARASTVRSTLATSTAIRQTSRQKAQAPVQATPLTGNQPTIHALTNLRFPPSTAPALVEQYEALTRDLFATLGHSHDTRTSFSQIHGTSATLYAQRAHEILALRHPHAGPLAYALAHLFTSMLRVLNAATLTGPLTALLKLVSHLAFLSPAFALACCGAEASVAPSTSTPSTQRKSAPAPAPTKLVSLVAHVIARYGRPSQADREKQSRDALASATSNASMTHRPRRAKVTRNSAGRRSSSMAGGLGGKKGNLDATDVVENFDPEKRARLLDAALALLEGVAWKCLADQDGGAAYGLAEDA